MVTWSLVNQSQELYKNNNTYVNAHNYNYIFICYYNDIKAMCFIYMAGDEFHGIQLIFNCMCLHFKLIHNNQVYYIDDLT